MESFNYLIEKINFAEFKDFPFRHLLIENFFSTEHFEAMSTNNQIRLKKPQNTELLIKDMLEIGWRPQIFPGCTNSIRSISSTITQATIWKVEKVTQLVHLA